MSLWMAEMESLLEGYVIVLSRSVQLLSIKDLNIILLTHSLLAFSKESRSVPVIDVLSSPEKDLNDSVSFLNLDL